MRTFKYSILTLFCLTLAACISASDDDLPEPERIGQVSQALTLGWSGYTWNVKNGTGMGPGPNNWSDSTSSVWIDGTGSLNLKVRKSAGKWYCAEVWLPTGLGRGTYEFFIKTRTDLINRNLVNGFFLYQDDTHELDVEWSKWGSASNPNNGDFGIQPSTFLYWNQAISSGAWQKDRIIWTAGVGGAADTVRFQVETDSVIVQDWTQALPAPIDTALALVHINNWMFQGMAPSDGAASTLTLVSFTFTP